MTCPFLALNPYLFVSDSYSRSSGNFNRGQGFGIELAKSCDFTGCFTSTWENVPKKNNFWNQIEMIAFSTEFHHVCSILDHGVQTFFNSEKMAKHLYI